MRRRRSDGEFLPISDPAVREAFRQHARKFARDLLWSLALGEVPGGDARFDAALLGHPATNDLACRLKREVERMTIELIDAAVAASKSARAPVVRLRRVA